MTEKFLKVEKVSADGQLHNENESAFTKYKMKVVGNTSFFRFCLYEGYTLFLTNLGGALGYVLRKAVAKYLFRSVGPGLILGRGLVIRNPARMTIGARVAIDDSTFLDGGGLGKSGIQLQDEVLLSRNCVVIAKSGHIVLRERVDVGFNCVFASAGGITIGASTIIAGNCFFGGGRYNHDKLELPIMDQGVYTQGETVIGENSWVGAGAIILDGVKLGKGVIVGAGAVVIKDAPDYAVLVGAPARVVRIREEQNDHDEMEIGDQ